MADAVSNPHDNFFRRMMTLPNAAVDIARQALPQDVLAQLDLSCVEQEETSWVDPDLKAHFADALYKIKFKTQTTEDAYLCILLEHKSSPDYLVAFQVLRYMVQVWQHKLLERKPPFSPIIPLVLYHGREKWTVPREFGGLFSLRPELQKYIPSFEYALLDISAKTEGNVQKVVDPYVRTSLRVMWLIFRGDIKNQLPGVLKDLPPDERDVLQLLETICRYVLSGSQMMQSEMGTVLKQTYTNFDDIKVEFFEELREKARAEARAEARAVGLAEGRAEGWETGRAEGRAEGWEIGRLESLQNSVNRLLKRKFRDQLTAEEIVSRLQTLSASQLETLTEDLLDFQSPADFQQWLGKQPQ